MPAASHDGVDLYFERRGDPDGPPVALVGDACVGAWTWAWLVAELEATHDLLLYDPRGTGRSDAPGGPYDVATLAGDLEAVLGAADWPRVHLAGVGLGGMVALAYAGEHGRARSLHLQGTAASHPGFDPGLRETLLDDDPASSLRPLVGDGFLDTPAGQQAAAWREGDAPRPGARAAQLDAVETFSPPPLHDVALPARVLHGTADGVWPPDGGEALADRLPRGSFEAVTDAHHLLPVTAPRAVADDLAGHVETTGAD